MSDFVEQTTQNGANLARGRMIRRLGLHKKSCAQCQAATDNQEWCDDRCELEQAILDFEDDARAARGEQRLQS